MLYSYKLEFPQSLVNDYYILSRLVTDKVMGIVQTWLLTLLESFLPVQMRKNRRLVHKNHHVNLNVTILQTKIAQTIG